MELTKDQNFVLKNIFEKFGEFESSPNFSPNFHYLTIGGYAGTGKTFLISQIRNEINKYWKNINVAFIAFTGKASSVLRSKLIENNSFFENDYCGTIHSLIYRPEFSYDKNLKKMVIKKWIKKESIKEYNLLIIDEASMINKDIWFDLTYYNIPIIAVGDHGQLPPIGENFNLMENPDFTLNEIKRQSLENPIIKLSSDIRNNINIPFGFYDKDYKKVFKCYWDDKKTKDLFNNLDFTDENLIVLCAMNKTRMILNKIIRDKLNYKQEEPYPGERVICLKNNHFNKTMNGQIGTVNFLLYEAKNVYNMSIKMDGFDDLYYGLVFKKGFNCENYQDLMSEVNKFQLKKIVKNSNYDQIDLFDFGYVTTVHRSQGSEWNKIVLFQERSYYWDDEFYKKWLYTAVTRSKEKLFIIV